MKTRARQIEDGPDSTPLIEVSETTDPENLLTFDTEPQPPEIIPRAEDSHIRLRTHNLLQNIADMYGNNFQPRVSLLAVPGISEKDCLSFRTKVMAILKHDFLLPALYSKPKSLKHRILCDSRKTQMLDYLARILHDNQYDFYLPPFMTRQITDKTFETDWTKPAEIEALIETITKILMIQPEESPNQSTLR